MDDNMVKEKITQLLQDNSQSGFLTQEIMELLGLEQMEVAKCLFDNDCFYYDEECDSFTGWRIRK